MILMMSAHGTRLTSQVTTSQAMLHAPDRRIAACPANQKAKQQNNAKHKPRVSVLVTKTMCAETSADY